MSRSVPIPSGRWGHAHRPRLRKDPEYTLPDRRNGATDVAKAVALIGIPPPPTDPPDNQFLARSRQRHADIHELQERRYTIGAIARVLGLDRKTARRFATQETPLPRSLSHGARFPHASSKSRFSGAGSS